MRKMYSESQLKRLIDETVKPTEIVQHTTVLTTGSGSLTLTYTDSYAATYTMNDFLNKYYNKYFTCLVNDVSSGSSVYYTATVHIKDKVSEVSLYKNDSTAATSLTVRAFSDRPWSV